MGNDKIPSEIGLVALLIQTAIVITAFAFFVIFVPPTIDFVWHVVFPSSENQR